MPIITNFGRGIVNDSRETTPGVSQYVGNFDIFTSPNRLIPYRSSEDGNSNSVNDLMRTWCVAPNGSTYYLYGLGRQTATDKVRIFIKALSTGAATDLDDNGWTETANNTASAQSTVNYNCFVYYPKLNMIFGGHGGRYIFEYDPDGGTAFNETDADLTSFTNLGQGIVHSKDDILYIPYDNKIAKNDNGSWTVAALTLPSQYYITSICEFNNYIAIACAPLSGVGNSRLFIWDRSTTLATISESIDWGSGNLKVLEEIGGYIVGISHVSGTPQFKDRIVFRYYTGAGYQTTKEILVSSGANLTISKQKTNNRIYFMMSVTINGTRRDGVWSFGRMPDNTWNLVHERSVNNDTATTGAVRGFYYIGDYLFQAFTLSNGNHTVTKTDDQETYSHTSIWESTINPAMPEEDKFKKKQLTSIIIRYAPLPATNGQVIVKYKVDGGSYTTVFTETGDNVVFTEMPSANGTGFTAGRDYEFQINSSGGGEIVGFEYNYDILETLA